MLVSFRLHNLLLSIITAKVHPSPLKAPSPIWGSTTVLLSLHFLPGIRTEENADCTTKDVARNPYGSMSVSIGPRESINAWMTVDGVKNGREHALKIPS